MRSAVGYLSSNLSTQPALMSSVRVASSGKTRARRLCRRLMAWVVCLTWACNRPATSRNKDHRLRRGRGGVGLFDDGEAGHGLALGVVGGAFGEVGLLIVLVAFGLADGNGHGQAEAAEELFEIGGVLAGGIDADVEMGLGMLFMQLVEAILQGLVAGAVFHHGEGLGGGLAIGPEEGDAMAVASGVDADADAVEGRSGGHGRSPERRDGERPRRHASSR